MSRQTRQQPTAIHTYARDLLTERKRRKQGKHEDLKSAVSEPVKKHTATKVKKERKEKVIKVSHITAPKKSDRPEIPKPVIIKPTKKESGSQNTPSFHELQKKVEASHKDKLATKDDNTNKITILPKQKKLNIGYDATIITDTKSDSFEVVPSIIKSIKEWFNKLKRDRKRKSVPKFEIPETKRRKGVIQKATSQSGVMFTTSSKTLKDRIKNRKGDEAEITINDPEISWSPYTEPSFKLLETSDSTLDVKTEYKKQSAPVKKEIPPTNLIETQIEPVEVLPPQEIKEVIPKPPLEETLETTVEQEIRGEEITKEYSDLDESRWNSDYIVERSDTKNYPATPDNSTVAEQNIILNVEKKTESRKIKTNQTTLNILIIIIALIVIIFITMIVMKNLSENTTQVNEISIDLILKKASLSPLNLTTSNIDKLPDLIKDLSTNGQGGVREIVLISPDKTEISPAYIFNLLRLSTSPILEQSLTSVRFIAINDGLPSILLKFTDFESIQGSFFIWETSMINDLSILYPNLDIKIPVFTDRTTKGIDSRVVRNNNNEVVLVYGIIDNTAIISNNLNDFKEILDLLKSN